MNETYYVLDTSIKTTRSLVWRPPKVIISHVRIYTIKGEIYCASEQNWDITNGSNFQSNYMHVYNCLLSLENIALCILKSLSEISLTC